MVPSVHVFLRRHMPRAKPYVLDRSTRMPRSCANPGPFDVNLRACRHAGQWRQHNRGRLQPRRASAGPCVATVTTFSKASSPPGRSSSAPRTTCPLTQQQLKQQEQQRARELAVVLSRRTLSLFATPGQRQQQQQQEHGTGGPCKSKVENGGRVRRASGRSGSGSEGRLDKEGEETAAPHSEKVCGFETAE